MSSVNQVQPIKQFRCLPASKQGSLQYVEIITSADESGNYQTKLQLVDSKELKSCWADFYYRSGRGASGQ